MGLRVRACMLLASEGAWAPRSAVRIFMVGLEGCGGLCLHPEHGANLGPVRGCSEGCGVVATAQRLEPYTARSVEEGNPDMCASCQGTCGGLRKVAECNKKAG